MTSLVDKPWEHNAKERNQTMTVIPFQLNA